MKKSLAVTTAIVAPVALTGAAIRFAPAFMWQFGYGMKTPMTILGLLVGLFAGMVVTDNRKVMSKCNQISTEYFEAEWRTWTAINVAVVFGVLWLLVQAIPSPDYDKQIVYVDKPVIKQVPVIHYEKERVVYHSPSYQDAFEVCRSAMAQHSESLNDNGVALCHKQASEASLPPYRTLTRTVTVHDPFQKLFADCVSLYDTTIGNGDNVQSIVNRNSRMEVCRKVALSGSTGQQ